MRAIDEHLREAPPGECLPILLGLVGFWNATLLGHPTVAVLPYCAELARFPAYLQQLTMESNGKHVDARRARRRLEHGAGLLGRAGHQRPALASTSCCTRAPRSSRRS